MKLALPRVFCKVCPGLLGPVLSFMSMIGLNIIQQRNPKLIKYTLFQQLNRLLNPYRQSISAAKTHNSAPNGKHRKHTIYKKVVCKCILYTSLLCEHCEHHLHVTRRYCLSSASGKVRARKSSQDVPSKFSDLVNSKNKYSCCTHLYQHGKVILHPQQNIVRSVWEGFLPCFAAKSISSSSKRQFLLDPLSVCLLNILP